MPIINQNHTNLLTLTINTALLTIKVLKSVSIMLAGNEALANNQEQNSEHEKNLQY